LPKLKRNRPALVTYGVQVNPVYDASLSLLKQAAAAGADVIELGMPFSESDGRWARPFRLAAVRRIELPGRHSVKLAGEVRQFSHDDDQTTPLG